MPRPESIQWQHRRWLGDNKVLSMEWDAKGMHFHLLMMSIQEKPPGSLPNDMALIRRWLGSPSDDVWRRIQPQIFSAWALRDGRWFNAGMVETFERKEKFSSRPQNHPGTTEVPQLDHKQENREREETKIVLSTKKKRPSVSKGCRLPEDYIPKPEHYALAAELGLNCEMEFQKFRDYWIGKSGQGAVKCDWDATLRNWIRNSAERYGVANGTKQISKAEERVARSRKNIFIGLGISEAVGCGGASVPVGNPACPDESLVPVLRGRKS